MRNLVTGKFVREPNIDFSSLIASKRERDSDIVNKSERIIKEHLNPSSMLVFKSYDQEWVTLKTFNDKLCVGGVPDTFLERDALEVLRFIPRSLGLAEKGITADLISLFRSEEDFYREVLSLSSFVDCLFDNLGFYEKKVDSLRDEISVLKDSLRDRDVLLAQHGVQCLSSVSSVSSAVDDSDIEDEEQEEDGEDEPEEYSEESIVEEVANGKDDFIRPKKNPFE